MFEHWCICGISRKWYNKFIGIFNVELRVIDPRVQYLESAQSESVLIVCLSVRHASRLLVSLHSVVGGRRWSKYEGGVVKCLITLPSGLTLVDCVRLPGQGLEVLVHIG